MQNNETPSHPSTLENIDTAVFRYVDETLNPHTTTNKGWEKIKILWLGTERAYQIKNNKELRDGVGKLRLPLITVSRTSVSRDDAFKGAIQASYYGEMINGQQYIPIKKKIQQDKTQNFQNAESHRITQGDDAHIVKTNKVVYEIHYVPKPIYVACSFEINIRTEYQQQMNDILHVFIPKIKNYIIIESEGYQYEAFIEQDYSTTPATNLSEDERVFTSKIQIKVLGYLTGNSSNNEQLHVIKKETVVDVKISKERCIVGDEKPWNKTGEKIRDL
jgi:hypothetical protein